MSNLNFTSETERSKSEYPDTVFQLRVEFHNEAIATVYSFCHFVIIAKKSVGGVFFKNNACTHNEFPL